MMVPVKFDQDCPTGFGDILVQKCGGMDARTYAETPRWTMDPLAQVSYKKDSDLYVMHNDT